MRRGLIVCAAAIAIGLLGDYCRLLLEIGALLIHELASLASLPWMINKREASSGSIADYQTECALMCARIAETDEQLAKLICDGQQVTPEIQSAIIETDRLRSECRVKMLEHFYRDCCRASGEETDRISPAGSSCRAAPGSDGAIARSSSPSARREQIEYHLFLAGAIMGSWLGLRKILTFSRCRGCARETTSPLMISWTAGKVD